MTRKETFQTPEPIAVEISNPSGKVEIRAEPTDQTTVTVDGDDSLVDQTTVEYSGDRLRVAPPDRWIRRSDLRITVIVPEQSTATLKVASAGVRCLGPLGALTSSGASGRVEAEEVVGEVDIRTASGDVRLGAVGQLAGVNTASGGVEIGAARSAQVRTVSGDVRIGHVEESAAVRAVSGDVRFTDAYAGEIEATTTSGDVMVAVRPGTAVELHLSSLSGRVHSTLPVNEEPPGDTPSLRIRTKSVSGNITLTRRETVPTP